MVRLYLVQIAEPLTPEGSAYCRKHVRSLLPNRTEQLCHSCIWLRLFFWKVWPVAGPRQQLQRKRVVVAMQRAIEGRRGRLSPAGHGSRDKQEQQQAAVAHTQGGMKSTPAYAKQPARQTPAPFAGYVRCYLPGYKGVLLAGRLPFAWVALL